MVGWPEHRIWPGRRIWPERRILRSGRSRLWPAWRVLLGPSETKVTTKSFKNNTFWTLWLHPSQNAKERPRAPQNDPRTLRDIPGRLGTPQGAPERSRTPLDAPERPSAHRHRRGTPRTLPSGGSGSGGPRPPQDQGAPGLPRTSGRRAPQNNPEQSRKVQNAPGRPRTLQNAWAMTETHVCIGGLHDCGLAFAVIPAAPKPGGRSQPGQPQPI